MILNNLPNLSCVKDHFEFDQGFFSFTEWAMEDIVPLLLKIDRTSCLETMPARCLLVAQSIVCAVVLPFKMLLTFILGIDAMCHPKAATAWANLAYSLASVASYAAAIPATAILACAPLKAINELRQMIILGRAAIPENDQQRFRNLFTRFA